MFSSIPRQVVVLSIVSLLTDCSSEMIYPLLPLFLTTQIGASATALGLIEGVAESTASLIKLISGVWSDRLPKRKPFILIGYAISGFFRPLVGIAPHWFVVLGIRFVDRVGKGIRTSPRDSMISEVTKDGDRGKAYGFHRGMDHFGAVIGPLTASALLLIPGMTLGNVFLLASIPAAISIWFLWAFLKETPREHLTKKAPAQHIPLEEDEPNRFSFGIQGLNSQFKWFLVALTLFTLGNATDAFILLRLTQVGIEPSSVAFLWGCQHMIKVGFSLMGGNLSDRLGERTLITVSWIFYGLVYLLFAVLEDKTSIVALFLVYGIYFGFSEPAERALVSKLSPLKRQGSGFGWFHFVVGIASLPASLLFGIVWEKFGYAAAFLMGGLFALAALPPLFWSYYTKKA